MNLSRRIWLTGASSGIGLELTRRLLAEGHCLALSARRAEPLLAFARRYPGRVLALPGDLTDSVQVRAIGAAIESHWGALDSVILNAGSCEYSLSRAVHRRAALALAPARAPAVRPRSATGAHASQGRITMKIAIIGSGIAGLTCAHLLARQHAVTVFESASWIGGHTHTVDVRLHGRDYAVDTGFIVFNDWTYPNFIKLLGQLGVRYKPTEMSFSVCDPQRDLEYNGHSLNTLFAQRSNLLSPPFWGMLRDILRFNREALDDYHNGRIPPQVTLGSYLRLGRYSQRFIDHYIVPMGAAIWSMSPADMLEFPLEFVIRFCKNHGLLSANDRPQWYVVEGGSSAYVSPLTKGFSQHIRLNCPVFEVLRDEHGVTIQSPAGAERFDKVIFACHSDQALRLLAQPSQAERDILGAIGYAGNDVVLHTDIRLLPRRPRAWASWNYRLGGPSQQPAAGSRHLQHEHPARYRGATDLLR